MLRIERVEIFKMIEEERGRQDKLHPLPKKKESKDKELEALTKMLVNNEFLAVLVEEIGEVGTALQGEGDLKEELIQVASVCVRWLENI